MSSQVHQLTQPSPWALLLMISCVVDVTSERVWVKKPGEEINIKSKAQTKTGFFFGNQILYVIQSGNLLGVTSFQ